MLWVLQVTIVHCTLSLLTNCYRCTFNDSPAYAVITFSALVNFLFIVSLNVTGTVCIIFKAVKDQQVVILICIDLHVFFIDSDSFFICREICHPGHRTAVRSSTEEEEQVSRGISTHAE